MAVMCPVVSMTHTGSEPKEKSHKNKKKLSKNQMKLRVIHIWSNRGCTAVYVAVPKQNTEYQY